METEIDTRWVASQQWILWKCPHCGYNNKTQGGLLHRKLVRCQERLCGHTFRLTVKLKEVPLEVEEGI